MSQTDSSLRQLTQQFSQTGTLEAIYLRPARGVASLAPSQAEALQNLGLVGDRSHSAALQKSKSASKLTPSKRQITLIQAEHIAVISALINKPVNAANLRRNLVVAGINLLAAKSLFKDQTLQLNIGEVMLEITGPCEPCSKMETVLGHGGYNAMRGHGGVTAKIIKSGQIKVGDVVSCKAV